jgi:hemolysin III
VAAHWLEQHVSLAEGERGAEERASAISHGVAACLSVAAFAGILVSAKPPGLAIKLFGLSVFGITAVSLFTISTIYHAARRPGRKRLFRLLDHVSIYLLIAGTYTPISLTLLHGAWGHVLLALVWVLAAIGIAFKVFLMERFRRASLFSYLAMGWIILLNVPALLRAAPSGFLIWILAGGLFYTGGTVLYAAKKVPYNHALWHLAVMAGTACHIVAMALYIVP